MEEIMKTDGQIMSLIGDMASLLQQIKQSLGTDESPMEELMVEEAMGTIETDEEGRTEKGLETTPSDGQTASDDAEERIEDPLPDGTQEATDMVAKTLVEQLLTAVNKQKKPVKKSENNKIAQTLSELTKVVKSIVDKQNENQYAIESILKGLSVDKEIEVINKSKTVEKDQGNGDAAIAELTKLLQKSLGGNEEEKNHSYNGQRNQIGKSLSNKNLLTYMVKKQ
jgi:hypothetical protein